jgi:hypothetical protein
MSIAQAIRLPRKARETVMKAAAGLESKRGPKNSKLYNANHLMNERLLRQRACALLAIKRKVLARRVLKLRG